MKFTREQEEMVRRSNIVSDIRRKHTSLGLQEIGYIVNWTEGDEAKAHALAHDFVHVKTSWHEQYRERFELVEARLGRAEERLDDRPTNKTIDGTVKRLKQWCYANFRSK